MKPAIRIVLSSVLMFWVVARCPAQVPMDENKDLFTPRGATAKPAKPPKNAKEAFEPTLVTLRCDHMSPREAVDELSLELGYPLQPRFINFLAANEGEISISDSKKPYWVVVRDVCDAANVQVLPEVAWGRAPYSLSLRTVTPNQMLILSNRDNYAVVPAIRGAYFEAQKLANGKEGSIMHDHVHVSMMLLAEPKVFVASYSSPDVTHVVDDGGKELSFTKPSLPGQQQESPREIYYASRWSMAHEFNVTPKTTSKSIRQIKGTMGVTVGLDIVTQDVSSVLSGKQAKVPLPGGYNITFLEFAPGSIEPPRFGLAKASFTPTQFKLSLRVPKFRSAEGETFASSAQMLSSRIDILDEHDRPFVRRNGTFEPPAGGVTDDVSIGYDPPLGFDSADGKKAVPAKVIFTMCTRVEKVVLPFEFNNIPLPAK